MEMSHGQCPMGWGLRAPDAFAVEIAVAVAAVVAVVLQAASTREQQNTILRKRISDRNGTTAPRHHVLNTTV